MALSSRKQVEDLADILSACADSMHARLIRGMKKGEIGRETGMGIFQCEAVMRQHANSLYADAVRHVIKELLLPQKKLIEVVDKAKSEIEVIANVRDFIDLAADLVAFASAVCTGKPATILPAFEEICRDLDSMDKRE